jgi:ribosomal protein S15P/S13E
MYKETAIELTGTFACDLFSSPVDVTVLNEAITKLLSHHSIN